MKTLLEKAKEVQDTKQRAITDEHIELAIALMEGKITMKQHDIALGLKAGSGQGYITFSRSIVKAYQQGKISVLV
jgi:hypothetical protein